MKTIGHQTDYRRAIIVLLILIGVATLWGLGLVSAKHSAARTKSFQSPSAANLDRDAADRLFSRKSEPPRGPVKTAVSSTFTVTRSDDIAERGTCAVGDCTLREAIIAANSTAGADTITFAAALNGVPITLTQTGVDPAEDAADYGDLDITESVTITGNGTGNTIIQAGAAAYGGIDKIFAINPNCTSGGASITVSISDMTLRNGHNAGPFNASQFNHTGGAIDFCGGGAMPGANSLTMTNVIVRDCLVDQGAGGGLNVAGTGTAATTITLTNSQFLNNKTIDNTHVSSGAGVAIELNTSSISNIVNISGCLFDNNEASGGSGGGLEVESNIAAGKVGSVTIHNSVFNNNRAKAFGGGIDLVVGNSSNVLTATIDQETVIKNNVTGFNSGTSFGGGIHIDLGTNAFANLSKVSIINNSESNSATLKLGGGGIGIANAPGTGATGGVGVSIQFSRIAGNTLSAGAGVGTGLRKDNQPGTVNATNNWWGCSAGPAAAPCDTAVVIAGGTLTTSPFLRLKTTPTTDPIIVNQSSGMTSRMQNSSGVDTPVGSLDVFINSNTNAGSPLPVVWSSVGGTLSLQQSPLQSSGGFAQVTATYQGTAALASNSATAKVDNDSTSGASNTGSITVNKGNTTASITSQSLATTLTGQSFTVNFNAIPSNTTNSPTAMSGNVTVSDGVNNCSGAINGSGNGSCSLALDTVGSRSLTATYVGDSNFNASAASPALSHTVTNIATWTGTTDTVWNTGTNWATGAVPGSIHDANIPSGALPNEPTIGAISVTVINLTIGSGHTLTVNAGGTLTATGTTNVTGTFGGSGGTHSFNNLTIGNAAGVTLGGNATVSGVLALTAGDLNVGANTLTQPNTASSTGSFDVVGNVKRTGFTSAPNTLSFGNPNNQLTFTAGTLPTDITINLVKAAPSGFANAVQRTYTITPNPSNLSGFTAKLRLHYLDAELNGNTPESSLNLRRFNGTGWAPYAPTTPVDTSNNWVENNAVHNFSQWTFSTFVPTAAGGMVTGRIVDSSGRPVEGAVVLLSGSQTRKFITDANGLFRFENVETGEFYTVTPSRTNYHFNPFNRSFSQTGNQTEAAFTAESMGDDANPLDTAEYFVRQQYVDVLGREPDEAGFNYWSDKILACGEDAQCVNTQRREVAAAFFISEENQASGSFIYDAYAAALGRRPAFAEFSVDRTHVVGGATLDADKTTFARSFVQRAEFVTKYQNATSATAFVDALLLSVRGAGADLSSERMNLIELYGQSADQIGSRAAVLRSIADHATFKQSQYNQAFVLTEYFSYLRRDVDAGGYDFWLGVLNTGDAGNYRGMVCSFVTSREYQNRFSRIVTHANGECSGQ